MRNSIRSWSGAMLLAAGLTLASAGAQAGAREEGKLLTATEVLEEVQGMPDQRLPDLLLSRAYGIAIIPDVVKIGLTPVGGSRGHGVLIIRDGRVKSDRKQTPVPAVVPPKKPEDDL